ncbi:hypothetical protein FB567DRAFT_550146 [Paraphoma chrysanthemicola]|uniref:Uncharacterized protein n=1 Tax=Paraphoma chrysanthemicola TaxID=798071 RepID=A0A8K0R4B0_9PLEO|nr:hypothetical protein FB567DRAFT_550146 [Paraphoma chrysanthemicola]
MSCTAPQLSQPISVARLSTNPTSSPSSLPNDMYPRGVPKNIVIILVVIIPTVFILALIMGIIHCIRKRNKRQLAAQRQDDIEKSLRHSRRPVLTLDTDLPNANELQRSASAGAARLFAQVGEGDGGVHALPTLSKFQSAPSGMYRQQGLLERSPIEGGRSATRMPLGSHPPGVGGRYRG